MQPKEADANGGLFPAPRLIISQMQGSYQPVYRSGQDLRDLRPQEAQSCDVRDRRTTVPFLEEGEGSLGPRQDSIRPVPTAQDLNPAKMASLRSADGNSSSINRSTAARRSGGRSIVTGVMGKASVIVPAVATIHANGTDLSA